MNTTRQFPTQADIVSKVREIAAANPNHQYAVPLAQRPKRFYCSYLPNSSADGTTRCIIGEALSALGMGDGFLNSVEGKTISFILEHHSRESIANSPARWLRSVQGWQDMGKTWSEAVAAADNYIAKREAEGR